MHGLAEEEMRQAGKKVNKSFAPLQPAVLTAEGRLEGRARLPAAVHRALPTFVTYFASGKLGPPRKHMHRFIMGGGNKTGRKKREVG